MPCVIIHAMMSCVHHAACAHRPASHPYDFMVCHNLSICPPFAQAEGLLLKLTASHFNVLHMQIVNQNMLERILIAM